MSLTDDEREAIVSFRLQKGMETLKEAKGIVSQESGKLYSKLFELRQTGDYDDLFNLSEADVQPMISSAEKYIDELIDLINK